MSLRVQNRPGIASPLQPGRPPTRQRKGSDRAANHVTGGPTDANLLPACAGPSPRHGARSASTRFHHQTRLLDLTMPRPFPTDRARRLNPIPQGGLPIRVVCIGRDRSSLQKFLPAPFILSAPPARGPSPITPSRPDRAGSGNPSSRFACPRCIRPTRPVPGSSHTHDSWQ